MGDDLADERIADRQRDGDGGARLGDRLDGERIADVVAPRAAPRLRNGDAEQPLARGRVHHVGRELAGLVDARGALHDNLAREPFDLLFERFLFGRELEHHSTLRTNATTKDTKTRNTRKRKRIV